MTKQRQIIYDIICTSHSHLSADEIYLLAKAELPSIAVGTVYRNLGLMVAEGLIQKIPMDGEADRFDKNPTRHAHVICERCHTLSDLPLPDIAEVVRQNTGILPTSYTLNVYHICPKCEKQI
jgi:Fe2+ or Zn2+ uptake regulation protein